MKVVSGLGSIFHLAGKGLRVALSLKLIQEQDGVTMPADAKNETH